MRNYLFGLVLALSFLFGGAALADPGHKFCEKPLTPQEAADRMDRSLELDPSGNRPMAGCRANPLDFQKAWENEFQVPKELRQFSNWIRSFTEMTVEPGQQLYSACIRHDGNGVITRCVTRTLHDGEKAWGIGNEIYLLGDCVNPVNMTIEAAEVTLSPCVTLNFVGSKLPPELGGGAIRIAHVGPKPLPTKCLELAMAGGETMRGLPQECPDAYTKVIGGRNMKVVCSWVEVEAAVSKKLGVHSEVQNVSGSFYPRATGMNSLTLPRQVMDAFMAVCYELPDGSFVTVGVDRNDWVNGVATITDETIEKMRHLEY
ncbi:MAG TPA: hypothetical protein VHO23_03515 [Candidatus Paceibacterota bacterium]|nr:hypothetical protein [Candidatus Paceibacterota bacterium]